MGHGRHRYLFRLFALDRDLELDPEAGKSELEPAIEAHLLAAAELVDTSASAGSLLCRSSRGGWRFGVRPGAEEAFAGAAPQIVIAPRQHVR